MGATSASMASAASRTPAATIPAALADRAVTALLEEILLTPKPGLVDRRGRGAHLDMDVDLMCRSAHALRPGFHAMAEAAQGRSADRYFGRSADLTLRRELGRIGREAETSMLRATGGVNTHRGAIWAMGLLVASAAMDPRDHGSHGLTRRAGMLARLPDEHSSDGSTKGSRACAHYQVTGARGEAQEGFPHITRFALPTLRRYRAEGAAEDLCRVNALLAIMARLGDTCVLSRGGEAALAAVRTGAALVLAEGGAGAAQGRLSALEATLLAHNASPGGSADLLAATLFIDSLEGPSAP
jgi:triphosphoribosyl-dephospho-CoA synthase